MTPFLFISGHRPPSEDRNHYNDKYEQEPHPRCMLGAKQARRRVKPGAGGPPEENKLSLMERSWEFLPLPWPHFYDHIISSPLWVTAMMETKLFFFFFFFFVDLVVGTVWRCIFTSWSLAREKSAPSLLVLWRPSQLVWNDSMALVVSFETL